MARVSPGLFLRPASPRFAGFVCTSLELVVKPRRVDGHPLVGEHLSVRSTEQPAEKTTTHKRGRVSGMKCRQAGETAGRKAHSQTSRKNKHYGKAFADTSQRRGTAHSAFRHVRILILPTRSHPHPTDTEHVGGGQDACRDRVQNVFPF